MASRAREGWVTAAVVVLAFVVFRSAAQPVLHYQDSGFVLHQAHTHDARHPWHLLVLYPFVALREWLAAHGVSTWAACKTTVALGGAILVAASHRAGVSLGLPRHASITVAVLVACTPAVGYFATIVELQAVAMAATGLAVWAFVALGQRQDLRRAMALGLISALAAAAHSSCHGLVVAWWLFTACLWPTTPLRRVVVLLATASLVHAACFLALAAALAPATDVVDKSAGMLTTLPAAGELVRGFAHRATWEFLIPFAPTSFVLCALALRKRGGGGLLLAALVGLVMTMVLLTDAQVEERGAYLLHLAVPLAVFTVQHTPRRSWVLFALAGVLATLVLRFDQAEARPCDPEVAKGAAQLDAAAPRLFVSGNHLVLDSIAAHAPDLRCLQVTDLHVHGSTDPEQAAVFVGKAFDDLVRAIHPRTVVVDEATFAEWENGPWPELRSLATRHLPASYRATPIEAAAFRGYDIVRK